MSDKDTVAFNLLLNSLLKIHHANRERSRNEGTDTDFIDFTDEEIKNFVNTLWAERYQEDLTNFKSIVSSTILENSKSL
jgi:hypothetical protein